MSGNDLDGPDFWFRSLRRARKQHRCSVCAELIRARTDYVHVGAAWEHRPRTLRYCPRCWALLDHLSEVCDDGVDVELACGHSYAEIHDGPPPEHIAALAFWRPGDPLPEPECFEALRRRRPTP